MKKIKQLAFDLCLKDEASFENFFVGNNQELITALQKIDSAPVDRCIYLWGSLGSGRTHLLSACCNQFHKDNFPVAYLPLSEVASFELNILENLETHSLLCIDDINLIVGHLDWEEAIFHCYNKLCNSDTTLLITSNLPPQSINFLLPDLKSRLTNAVIFHIQPLNDEQKIQALKFRAKMRGLKLSDAVAKFLLSHHSRSTSDLFSFLEKLDKAALEERKKITIPFIKKLF